MPPAHPDPSACEQEAQDAQKQTNEYRLDKNHTFSVCMYDDFEKYSRVPESYAEPEEKPYVARVRTFLFSSMIPLFCGGFSFLESDFGVGMISRLKNVKIHRCLCGREEDAQFQKWELHSVNAHGSPPLPL